MQHFILTRYNVGLFSSNPYNIEDPGAWMDKRVELFNETYNSVMGQTNQGFEWFVYLDDNTPFIYVAELLDMFPDCNFAPASAMGFNAIIDQWAITTRLDNDDILYPEFVNTVQNAFCEKEGVIDVEGEQLDVATGTTYPVNRRYPNSPFISLVEYASELKTVFCKTHTDLHRDYKWSAYIKGNPLYTQVIHDHNLVNKINA